MQRLDWEQRTWKWWLATASPDKTSRQAGRRRKTRKQAGKRVKLNQSDTKAFPLPSLLLANVWLLENKKWRLWLAQQRESRDRCALIFTETWLHSSVPEEAVTFDRRSLFHADRTLESVKTRRGGLCIYITDAWCSLMLRCRPYYLPREFSSVCVVAVYIPPVAKKKKKHYRKCMKSSAVMFLMLLMILIKQTSELFYIRSTSMSTSPPEEQTCWGHVYINIQFWSVRPCFSASSAHLHPAD